jgi:hypothetical protein
MWMIELATKTKTAERRMGIARDTTDTMRDSPVEAGGEARGAPWKARPLRGA